MKSWRSHFVFNRSERNGIFFLVLLIIILQGIYFYVDFSSELELSPESQEEVVKFQAQIDSLKRVAAVEDTFSTYPFNPNFISDFKGYTLGMSIEEIDRLHAFRASDQWVNSADEFQQVTGIPDSLLRKLEPFFKFPVFAASENKAAREKYQKRSFPVQDLNEATPEALIEVNGVGEVLSQRIVRYRESIGGFRDEVQLNDVYGLSPEVVERIKERFRILKPHGGEKQDLNEISVLSLSEIPGFSYELARELVEYREQRKRIDSFEELGKIKGFPVEKLDRIQLYLTIDESNISADMKSGKNEK